MQRIFYMFKIMMKFIDIGANLTDAMFHGYYGGSQKHKPDLDKVLNRGWSHGIEKIIITIGSLKEAEDALKLANQDSRLFVTMGCHPTRCNEFASNPDEYYAELCSKIEENSKKVVAIGECGLDYNRLNFCEKDIQKKYFDIQLALVQKYQLPLFLHCRNSHTDFMEIVKKYEETIRRYGGVVHSFDGTLEEAKRFIDFGFFIGLNGCSLKTEDNLKVVKDIPNDKIMIETDSPWCGIRPSHAGYKLIKTQFPHVKKKEKWSETTLIDSRNEPCQIRQVIEVIAATKQEPIEKLADIFYNNTVSLFFKNFQP